MRENLTYGLKWRGLETGLRIPRQPPTLRLHRHVPPESGIVADWRTVLRLDFSAETRILCISETMQARHAAGESAGGYCSVPSRLDFRVESFKLPARVVDFELPVHTALLGIGLLRPRG